MGIEWGLLDPNAYQRGLQQGRAPFDEMEERRRRAALEAERRARLAKTDQEAALEKHRESIIAGAKIIRQLRPTDDASWQTALATAKQVGIDLSEVPQTFDPKYVQGLIATADALAPQGGSELMAVAPGSTVINKGTGQPVYSNPARPRYFPLAPGGRLVLDPSTDPTSTAEATTDPGGGPEPGTVEDGYRFKGGDPARPENWEPAGGQTVAPSGGFP